MFLLFKSILLFLLLLSMLIYSNDVTAGARSGLLLWYQSVVPALFPFMVLSGMIVAQGSILTLMTPIHAVFKHLLPLSKEGCYVLVTGLLCGYPMGAKTCADFVSEGRISIREGKYLLAICSHPSPMFILGYVYPFFKDSISISKLLFAVYSPLVLLAVIGKCIYYQNRGDSLCDFPSVFQNQLHSSDISSTSTDETILSSIEILCKIGGYLMIFSICAGFLNKFVQLPDFLRATGISILEMTTGIRELANISAAYDTFPVGAAAVSFGGLSGIFQTNAVLNSAKKAGLSVRPYIIWKLLHASLSGGIAAILCNF